jgi:hypothetical protein
MFWMRFLVTLFLRKTVGISMNFRDNVSASLLANAGKCRIPNVDVSTDQTDGIVPAINSNREIESCYYTNQTNWVPLFHQHVTRT